MNIGEKIVSAIDRAMSNEPATAALQKLSSPPAKQVDPVQVVVALAEEIHFETPAKVVEKLAFARREYKLLFARWDKLGTERHGPYVEKLLQDDARAIREAVARGEDAIPPLTHDLLEQKRQANSRALRGALKLVIVEFADMARPVLAEFIEKGLLHVDLLEARERQTAERYGVPYAATWTVAIRRVLDRLPKSIPSADTANLHNPANFLPWLKP